MEARRVQVESASASERRCGELDALSSAATTEATGLRARCHALETAQAASDARVAAAETATASAAAGAASAVEVARVLERNLEVGAYTRPLLSST